MTANPVLRREFLKLSGVAGILAAGRAPAFAQGTSLHFLQWSHFVPAADAVFEAQAREFGKQAGGAAENERTQQKKPPAPPAGPPHRRAPPPPRPSLVARSSP